MDKRSIIFIVCLSATLLLVNFWFSSKNKAGGPKVQVESPTTAQVAQKQETELAQKTAPISALPISSLFLDEKGTQFVTLAVRQKDNYLTFPWTSDLPEHLYVKSDPSDPSLDRLVLSISSSNEGHPILYSLYPKEKIQTAYLPEGSFDLQLVYFTNNNSKAQVILGKGENRNVITTQETPPAASMALFKIGDDYFPYGVFEAKQQRLKPLDQYPYYSALTESRYPEAVAIAQNQLEEFYVIENDYQQLVFSSRGGAIVGINLPFQSAQNTASVVKEIDIDRKMKKDNAINDFFPNAVAYTYNPSGGSPVKRERTLGGYYPLIRRSIQGPGGRLSYEIPAHFDALNIASDDPQVSNLTYTLRRLDKDLIVLESSSGQRKITKTFSFPKDPQKAPYCFDVEIKIDGDARGLKLTSGLPEAELISGNFSPSLKYLVNRNRKPHVEQLDLPKSSSFFTSVHPDWICNSNGFFGIIIDPLTEVGAGFSCFQIPGEVAPTRLTLIDPQYDLYPAKKYPAYEMHLPLLPTSQTTKMRVFAGPFETRTLKMIDATYSDPVTGYNPNYISCQSFHGWFAFISEPFAKFLFFLMNFFHDVTKSWGFSIILLTIALRIMMYPLNNWSIKSTLRMQQIAPYVTAIQEKYKKDPKRAQMEIVALYREKKVNPLTGCLPLLIQMPFLFGMFDLLRSTFDLRGAKFIPGWINNLAAPDILFSWNYPIIFVGTNFHLLPILLGVVMFYQQKMSSAAPKNVNAMTDQQRQQKFMGNIMVIVFTVLFYHFPSGLNIYWLSSMLLGILQQWWVGQQMKKQKGKPEILR